MISVLSRKRIESQATVFTQLFSDQPLSFQHPDQDPEDDEGDCQEGDHHGDEHRDGEEETNQGDPDSAVAGSLTQSLIGSSFGYLYRRKDPATGPQSGNRAGCKVRQGP